MVHVAFGRASAAEGKPAAEPRQHLPDLGLEDHDQGKHRVRKQGADQPVQRGQLTQAGEIKSERQRYHAHQHERGPRALYQGQELVDDDRDQQNIDDGDHRHVWPRR